MTFRNIIQFARVTIEFKTPFLVASGRSGEDADNSPVLDPNGLPIIPGTTIAGIIRDSMERSPNDSALVSAVFGPRIGENETAYGSLLTVSFAHIHDGNDVPLPSMPREIERDEVLGSAASPEKRHRVRMSAYGGPDTAGRGKYDTAYLAPGHRFTFDLLLRTDSASRIPLDRITSHLYSDETRIGGQTRSGFGAFSVVRCRTGEFDIGTPEGVAAYTSLPVRLDAELGLPDAGEGLPQVDPSSFRTRLRLEPDEPFWLTAAEQSALGVRNEAGSKPLQVPVVTWDDPSGTGGVSLCYCMPGSSVKGALAHRTAFHYNRINRRYADAVPDNISFEEWIKSNSGQECEAVRDLFGCIEEDGLHASAGRVFIDDCILPPGLQTRRLNHCVIDRFTGGNYSGRLYDEEVICSEHELAFDFRLDLSGMKDTSVIEAFAWAVRDLECGMLSLGARSANGFGIFRVPGGAEPIWTRLLEVADNAD